MSPSGTRQRPPENLRQFVTMRTGSGVVNIYSPFISVLMFCFARAATGVRDENLKGRPLASHRAVDVGGVQAV